MVSGLPSGFCDQQTLSLSSCTCYSKIAFSSNKTSLPSSPQTKALKTQNKKRQLKKTKQQQKNQRKIQKSKNRKNHQTRRPTIHDPRRRPRPAASSPKGSSMSCANSSKRSEDGERGGPPGWRKKTGQTVQNGKRKRKDRKKRKSRWCSF